VSTFATIAEALETLDDLAADDPLEVFRRGWARYLSAYRLDVCATAEPAAALIHAADLLTPERGAWCEARSADITRFIPDYLEPERRAAIARRGGPHMTGPRVLLMRLSIRESARGTQYLAGWLGRAKVVAFKAKEPDRYGNEQWEIFVAEPEPRAEPQQPAIAILPPPRRARRDTEAPF
jgi:hypothetical protein